ncbi:IclR family transcriptional regulator [Citricoccus sp. SGAir0253]|uniref:IclR family transcriptional regulator n=1 Tax=Citricoccus sp. SGAir0253 TaxID=2567881 RepID=UPI0010CCDDC7|nr:IclR family transcriptional regulator [Citricoccus sp. SGAir0253]QCU78901.1 IclR family transcriptional regulator [Citricoccus sp. SGAir0253]
MASSKPTAAGRVLAILDTFNDRHDSLSLSSIARRAGLTLPTAHRLVGELVEWGALHRQPDGEYAIGLKVLELGSLAGHRLRLRQLAHPYLHGLHHATRTNVHLSVSLERDILYLESMLAPDGAKVESRFGGRWPMHATATGRVLLAAAPPEQLDRVLQQPLTAYSAATETDPGRLRQLLAEVRQRGVAVAYDQIATGVIALAAPVTGPHGQAVAAIGITAPKDRFTSHQLIPPLTTTARRVSAALNGPDGPAPERQRAA